MYLNFVRHLLDTLLRSRVLLHDILLRFTNPKLVLKNTRAAVSTRKNIVVKYNLSQLYSCQKCNKFHGTKNVREDDAISRETLDW